MNNMTNPTPSPAPQQWAINAMEEICELQDGRQTEALHITSDNARHMIAEVITKHAAALSEERDQYHRMLKSSDERLKAYREWSEQAREAMAELLSYKISDHDLILDEAFLAKMRQVLQSHPEKQEDKWCAMCGQWGNHTSGSCPELHPAATNKTEEGKK